MCSPCRSIVILAMLALGCDAAQGHGAKQTAGEVEPLRVCADPNNLPFSNSRGEGFENRIAHLLAEELGQPLSYVWWPQRRGFARNTLRAGSCDVIVGVPTSYELAATTRPYYRSTYVFVTRAGEGLRISGFDDPRLRALRIGIHTIGDDYTNSPAAAALARRGIIDNVVGYSIYGDYHDDSPPARLIRAVADGEVDVAVAWGPLAGYYAPRQRVALALEPVHPQVDLPFTPFVYDIGMGVRREDGALRARIDAALERRRADVDGILRRYGVPTVSMAGGRATVSAESKEVAR